MRAFEDADPASRQEGQKAMILWQGVSRLDRQTPIVVIATTGSRNPKTGPMVQTWILRADMPPGDAVQAGEDAPICGTCPLRAGKGCYVQVHRAPAAIWRAWQAGRYAQWDGEPLGYAVRLGAYGDPAAAPLDLWQRATRGASVTTGYTHAWRTLRASGWRRMVMASVDSAHEAQLARARGWRTFRIATGQDAFAIGPEVECPNMTTGIPCISCGACNGARGQRGSIWIRAHGAGAGIIARQRAAA